MLGTPESLSGFSVAGPLERESPDDDKTPRGTSLNRLPIVYGRRTHLRGNQDRPGLRTGGFCHVQDALLNHKT